MFSKTPSKVLSIINVSDCSRSKCGFPGSDVFFPPLLAQGCNELITAQGKRRPTAVSAAQGSHNDLC